MPFDNTTKTEPDEKQAVNVSVDADAVKAAFSAWLVKSNGKKISPAGAIASLDAASSRFVKRKVSDVSIWHMTLPEQFAAAHSKAIKDKIFCVLTGHKNINFYRQYSQLYFDFLKARMSETENEPSPISREVASNITPPKENNTITKPTPDGFVSWLITQPNRNGTLYLEHVARAYLSSLRTAPSKLLINPPSAKLDVFDCENMLELEQLWSLFKQAPNYRDVNITTSSQFSAGMSCLLRYFEFLSNGDNNSVEINDHTDAEKRILSAFKAAFPISMNLGFVDLKKLQAKHEELYGETIELRDEQIYTLIRNNSIKIDANRYTHIDNLISPQILEKIKVFIDAELVKTSVHRVYSRPLFEEFKSVISYAVDEELLLTIIETVFENEYKANRKSMFISSKNNSYSPNVNEEIIAAVVKLLSEEISPFTVSEIAQRLPSYPRQKVEAVLNNLPNELVKVGVGKYVYMDYVYIEQNDIEKIKKIISSYMDINGTMTGDELYAKIIEDVPDIIELNPEISKQDVLKVVKSRLNNAFTVKQDWQSGIHFLPKEGV